MFKNDSLIMKNKDKNILFVMVSSLVATIGRGITLPFLPLYLYNNFHIDILKTGQTLTLAMCIGMFLSIPAGKLADKYNHKKLLFFSLVIFSISFLLIGNSSSILVFIIGFSFVHCSYAVYSIIIKCFISNNFSDKDKTKHFSLNYTFVNIGWIVGPLLGIFLAKISMALTFYISSLSGFISLLLIVKLRFVNNNVGEQEKSHRENISTIKLKPDNLLIIFTIGTLLGSFVFGKFVSCISQILITEFDSFTTQNIISLLISTNATTVILFQYITGVYISKRKQIVGFMIGAIFLVLGLLFFSFAKDNLYVWFLGIIIFSFGEIIFMPLQYRVIDMIAPPNNKAKYFTIQNLEDVGGALNPLITGYILSLYSGAVVYSILMLASFLSLLCFIFGISSFNRKKNV
ncbi:MFS transporter [Xenorhabdus sp. Reich]|uniref:MFS transporter n=1 Tax=Xenorhabdus littoralis TaxID=2582835 RepID=A0ABU4SQS4_9GAMM|nr:MFS transporter [Xenorhabdus sp. Reich]MDX8001002.1 MFS transporter [Xenorhabdus sp. Reich]